MDRNNCAVSGCGCKKTSDKEVIGHRFPKRRSVGLQWVQATGNAELQKLPYETITSKRFFVCRNHFAEKDFFTTQTGAVRLQKDAILTLNLPDLNNQNVLNESAENIDLPDVCSASSPSKDDNVALLLSSPLMGKLSTLASNSPGEEVRESSLSFAKDILQEKAIENFDPPVNAPTSRDEAASNELSRQDKQDEKEKEVAEEDNSEERKDQKEAVQTTPKTGKIRKRPSNLTFWRVADFSTPTKKKLFSQLLEQKAENYNTRKKIKRYHLHSLSDMDFKTKYTQVKKQYA